MRKIPERTHFEAWLIIWHLEWLGGRDVCILTSVDLMFQWYLSDARRAA